MSKIRKDVLNGWKEIGAYLGRDPRTVERWEKQRSLPVRRLPGSGRATVYALVSELDEWLSSSPARELEAANMNEHVSPELQGAVVADEAHVSWPQVDRRKTPAVAAPPVRRRWMRWVASAVVLMLLGWVALSAASRRKEVVEPKPDVGAGSSARTRTIVPSSAVPGVEELYLRGSYQAELRTPESLDRALDAFSGALKKDPHYAPAFAGLANTYILLREYSMMPDTEGYPKAKEAAEKALLLDPQLPQAHAALGFVNFFWDWNASAAENQFHTALQLDPDLALAHHWLGSVLTHEGRYREGLAELQIAQKLNPSSGAILSVRAFALGLSGHRSEASDMLQEAINSDRTGTYRNPATMHAVLGLLSLIPPRDIPRYLEETTRSAELRKDTEVLRSMQLASAVYRAHGEQAMWRALLQDERRRHAGGEPTYAMARYEAELGSKDAALNELNHLYGRHDPALIGVSVDPLFAGLQEDARFKQLRSSMGLPPMGEH